MRPLEGSSDEPEATCEQCGARGTVGRAARTDQDGLPTEIHRFCLVCWPEEMARYRARWQEEDRIASDRWIRDPLSQPKPPPRGMIFDAVTWHMPLELIRDIRRGAWGTASPADLRRTADDIARHSRKFKGEMPLEVEMFLNEHRGGTV